MKIGELDILFLVNEVIAFVMLFVGFSWDIFASWYFWRHNIGFGYMQILWLTFWGMYLVLNLWYHKFYGA